MTDAEAEFIQMVLARAFLLHSRVRTPAEPSVAVANRIRMDQLAAE